MLPELPSSSPLTAHISSKPRKPPTITPKRFTRFFTPRQTARETRKSKYQSKSARQLRDITRNAVNRKTTSPRTTAQVQEFEDIENETPRRSKRRKLSPALESSPLQSTPSKRVAFDSSPIRVHVDRTQIHDLSEDEDDMTSLCDDLERLRTPIGRLNDMSMSSRMLQRSFGGSRTLGRGRVRDHCADSQDSTSNFYTLPKDRHSFQGSALPFSTAACRSNSMVAIGDEDGGIRLVDSSAAEGIEFGKEHVSFRPHQNAIMDLSFSSDDYLFATASGDQTARVIDMRTQQTRYIMAGHGSSVKQIRFQPGNDSILATSSRDGSVQIWDLRCRGSNAPANDFPTTLESDTDNSLQSTAHRQVVYASTCISIRDAHSYAASGSVRSTSNLFAPKPDSSQRAEVSITALTFLPQGREHLFLTASEANASVKLWDIRARYSSRGPTLPVSSTAEPESHIKHRRFGLSSIALSGDGSRFYSLCRDNTIYAYSTNHLILGRAPEFAGGRARWRSSNESQTGLGPLYGFRHSQLKTSSFYIKAGIRQAKDDKEEMLAVGSRDGCAVLFPTDENYFRKTQRQSAINEVDEVSSGLPTRSSLAGSASALTGRGQDTIPIYQHGTALVRGHQSGEVTGLTWTHDGELVTIGDDFSARCWREGQQARELRTGGEGEGKRWNSGWADVRNGYDDDED